MAVSAIAGALGAAGSIAGGLFGAKGAKDAAATSAAAADRAAALNHEQYLQTRGDLAPYRTAGDAATNRLMALFGLTGQPGVAAPASAPTAAPAPAPYAPYDPYASTPQASGAAPEGYTYLPPRGGSGEGDTGFPGMLIDAMGNIVSMGATREEAMVTAGLMPDPNRNIMGQPAQPAAAPAPAAPAAPVSVGGLPGQNPLMPYAPPNGGVFAPEGGSVFRMDEATLRATPGYQFNLNEGMRAINAANAARGSLFSGNGLREAAKYAVGLADNTYATQAGVFNDNFNRQSSQFGTNLNSSITLNDQYWNRNVSPLFQLAGMGANAAAQTGQIGAGLSNASGQMINQAGVTSALARNAGGNALMTGINQAGNNLLYAYGRGWFNSPSTPAGAVDQGTWS